MVAVPVRRRVLSIAVASVASLVVFPSFAAEARANGILVAGSPASSSPSPGAPVRLVEHRVEARIAGAVADVTVEQRFHSDASAALEGTYVFPLPEGAVVSGFAMTMGGRMVEGEVVDAATARSVYEGIVRARRDPGILEYLGRGLFRARVFPIEPRADLAIRLRYQQMLPDDAGTLEMRYPLASARLNGAPVGRVSFDVRIESPVPIRTLYSPSHDVRVVREGERAARVTYERDGAVQDRDLLLYVGRSPEEVGFTLVSSKEAAEDGSFVAVFAPSTDVAADRLAPKDVVFVLDTSGSMQGEKLSQAKRALSFGLGTLRPADRFGLVAFATGVRTFRETLAVADTEARLAAERWIEGLRADGGTNIGGALEGALALFGGPARLPMVVFLTDGLPTVGATDPATLVRAATSRATGARVFTFGVGHDLDVNLLDRIAEATGGARDYVLPREDLELVLSRFFRKVEQPVLGDVTIEVDGGAHDVYPSKVPALFAGGQLVVVGRYREPGMATVRLRGRVGDVAVVREYRAALRPDAGEPFVARLWAERKTAFLLDEIRLHGEQKELVDEVIRLATRHGIVTPYTAALVVEDGEASAGAPLFHIGGGERRLGGRSQYRGPRSAVPPGLREPTDPSPTPPAPTTPSTPTPPPTTPAPMPAEASRDLERRKDVERPSDDGSARTRVVAGKEFRLVDDRWLDAAWDGKGETTKVEAFSEAWFALSKDAKTVKWLAVGERVVFVLGEGDARKVYEIVSAPAK